MQAALTYLRCDVSGEFEPVANGVRSDTNPLFDGGTYTLSRTVRWHCEPLRMQLRHGWLSSQARCAARQASHADRAYTRFLRAPSESAEDSRRVRLPEHVDDASSESSATGDTNEEPNADSTPMGIEGHIAGSATR